MYKINKINLLLFFFLDLKFNTYTPKADFNGMDCTDLVIGSARGSSSRIWDYYTRDRCVILPLNTYFTNKI